MITMTCWSIKDRYSLEAYFSKIVSIREEGLDAQHGNQIQQNQLHVNAQINPARLKKKENIIDDDSSQSRAQGSPFLLHHFKDGSR